MDHGDMNHGGMDMNDGCTASRLPLHVTLSAHSRKQMRMLFNADTTSTCMLHPAFRIHSFPTLLWNMLLSFLLAVTYERLRLHAQSYDRSLRAAFLATQRRRSSPPPPTDADTLLSHPLRGIQLDPLAQLSRSALYTLNVAVSFVLMLIVMTYNIYVIFAVLLGAFVGHFMYHSLLPIVEGDEAKGMQCH